jgi:glycosyltransferase involved in cell wall biosynthesis
MKTSTERSRPTKQGVSRTWAILTGEYPPQSGGVSDYTRSVARGLAAAGDDVHVWTGPCHTSASDEEGVRVHRLPDTFGPLSLVRLGRELARLIEPTLLVQYVPHAFGWKGMNVPFCLWLRRQRMRVVVMFHEVAFPVLPRASWKHRLLASTTRWMAGLVCRAADRRFVSTPSWEPILQQLAPGAVAATWLPVPSNVSTDPAAETVAECRREIQRGMGGLILGHFGTFGQAIAEAVATVLPPLLRADRQRTGLLIGRGSDVFAERLRRAHPCLAEQVWATGEVTAREVSAYLAACNLLLQPYPDGANGRRGSLMAGLALGLPILTTDGCNSEPLWRQTGAVESVPANDPLALVAAAERLLHDAQTREELGKTARLTYERFFGLEHTIERLRAGTDQTV